MSHSHQWDEGRSSWKQSKKKFIPEEEQELLISCSKDEPLILLIDCSYTKYLNSLKQNPYCTVISGYKNSQGKILAARVELPAKCLTIRKKLAKSPRDSSSQ